MLSCCDVTICMCAPCCCVTVQLFFIWGATTENVLAGHASPGRGKESAATHKASFDDPQGNTLQGGQVRGIPVQYSLVSILQYCTVHKLWSCALRFGSLKHGHKAFCFPCACCIVWCMAGPAGQLQPPAVPLCLPFLLLRGPPAEPASKWPTLRPHPPKLRLQLCIHRRSMGSCYW